MAKLSGVVVDGFVMLENVSFIGFVGTIWKFVSYRQFVSANFVDVSYTPKQYTFTFEGITNTSGKYTLTAPFLDKVPETVKFNL